MDIRRRKEILEEKTLSSYASLSSQSRGREFEENQCSIRTIYERDRDRILHSKAFRRLKHKTQVFIAPEGDHYRTRLTHTLEVSQISRTIASGLELNENLVEAIALGHDLGHTPFGHSGERVLNRLKKGGFKHNVQSLRVVDLLETRGDRQGLNLSYEVRDGILNHSGGTRPLTLEAQVVKLADRIAYLNHDLDDAIRAGVISIDELDSEIIENLGKKNSDRIEGMIIDIIESSYGKNKIEISDRRQYYMDRLREFLFDRVYSHRETRGEEEKVEYIMAELYNYYSSHLDQLPESYLNIIEKKEDIDLIVIDYIAGMTDRYIISLFKNKFIPNSWSQR